MQIFCGTGSDVNNVIKLQLQYMNNIISQKARLCVERRAEEGDKCGNDVFGVLPTGYGKSLCYVCLPFFFDEFRYDGLSFVGIVVTSLTAIMIDQVLDTLLALLDSTLESSQATSPTRQHKNCYHTGWPPQGQATPEYFSAWHRDETNLSNFHVWTLNYYNHTCTHLDRST